jgi:hypothetical protein
MTDELEGLKGSLKESLPKRIGDALACYDDFRGLDPGETAKEFAAHHAACKSALSHIDLLVKLLRWAEGDEKESLPLEQLGETDLLARARKALLEDDASVDGDGDEDDAP